MADYEDFQKQWLGQNAIGGMTGSFNQATMAPDISDMQWGYSGPNLGNQPWRNTSRIRGEEKALAGLGGGGDEGFGWNKGTASMISAGLGGIGNLANAWAALKTVGLGERELDWKKSAWDKDFAQQMAAYRNNVTQVQNRQRDVNAWKAAQTPGGYEMAKLVV